jgi:hypothetical protein
MAFASDPIALAVAGDIDHLTSHEGAVELCGFVKLVTRWKPDMVAADPGDLDGDKVPKVVGGASPGTAVAELHLYTSFGQWLEIPRDSVRGQRANVPEKGGRSQIWVDANACVKLCRATVAADVAQTLSAGTEDPTAFPSTGPK